MKAIVAALFVCFAVASAQYIVPQAYGYGLGLSAINSPLAYSGLPLHYGSVAAVPSIQSGYVAATRGSVHTAPLPEGPFAFSHHINTAPAPGTF